MQSLTQSLHRYSYDVFDEDGYSYVTGEAKAEMARMIEHTEQVLDQLRVELAPHLPVLTTLYICQRLIVLAYCFW